jgi:hypothetical protein
VTPRVRKAAGGLIMLVFLFVYAVLMTTIAGHLPDNRAVQLVFYAVAGLGWCLPLFPLIYWMEKGRLRR